MKELFIFSFILLLGITGLSQNPVHWSYTARKIADKTFELHLTAVIDYPWHIYSQFTPKDGPSLPTKIILQNNPLIILQDKVKEVGIMVIKHEDVLQIDMKYFSNSVDFVQVVKLKYNDVKTNIAGTIEFMACNDHQCLRPTTTPFKIELD